VAFGWAWPECSFGGAAESSLAYTGRLQRGCGGRGEADQGHHIPHWGETVLTRALANSTCPYLSLGTELQASHGVLGSVVHTLPALSVCLSPSLSHPLPPSLSSFFFCAVGNGPRASLTSLQAKLWSHFTLQRTVRDSSSSFSFAAGETRCRALRGQLGLRICTSLSITMVQYVEGSGSATREATPGTVWSGVGRRSGPYPCWLFSGKPCRKLLEKES
jgi:hypothetical protein